MSNAFANGQAADVLFLHAQTAMHPGSGTALGVVDLPVQRERHTQWPIIAGSALKGILRDTCRERAKEEYTDIPENGPGSKLRTRRQQANEGNVKLVGAFGPGTPKESSEHAGALSVTDARLLAFPVRSLRGVFAWVTCPESLRRLSCDLQLASCDPIAEIPSVPDNRVACVAGSPLIVAKDKVVLEEFEFSRTADDTSMTADWISCHAAADTLTRDRVRSHLAVISDDDFGHFVRHATEVVARIGLNYERKTVKDGALFYQEFLPPETIFYTLVLANESRKEGDGRKAHEILEYVKENTRGRVLQVGGDESTGKGLCTVRWLRDKEASS